MPGSGILNVRQWRTRLLKGEKMNGITPLTVAAELQKNAAAAHRLVEEVRPAAGKSKELRLTLGDADAMADLAEYYAEKILAAGDLALFDSNGKTEHRASAVRHLETALAHWKAYAAIATGQYKPQYLGRLNRLTLRLTVPASPMVTLRYRHVNQAERWQSVAMEYKGQTYRAEIPAAYTQSPFALEYYFYLAQDGSAALYPGFNEVFANQPYFVVPRT